MDTSRSDDQAPDAMLLTFCVVYTIGQGLGAWLVVIFTLIYS